MTRGTDGFKLSSLRSDLGFLFLQRGIPFLKSQRGKSWTRLEKRVEGAANDSSVICSVIVDLRRVSSMIC